MKHKLSFDLYELPCVISCSLCTIVHISHICIENFKTAWGWKIWIVLASFFELRKQVSMLKILTFFIKEQFENKLLYETGRDLTNVSKLYKITSKGKHIPMVLLASHIILEINFQYTRRQWVFHFKNYKRFKF